MVSFNGEDFAALTVSAGRDRTGVTCGFAHHVRGNGNHQRIFPDYKKSGGCTPR
jgi:hypothetical protein